GAGPCSLVCSRRQKPSTSLRQTDRCIVGDRERGRQLDGRYRRDRNAGVDCAGGSMLLTSAAVGAWPHMSVTCPPPVRSANVGWSRTGPPHVVQWWRASSVCAKRRVPRRGLTVGVTWCAVATLELLAGTTVAFGV